MDYIIEVKFKDDIIKGILIKENDEFMTIKLSSGYNANLKKSQIEEISRSKTNGEKNFQDMSYNEVDDVVMKGGKKDLPKIVILHTGGTIASKVDYKTGAVSSKFTPDELMSLYPEIEGVADIEARMLGNLFSEDMRFDHYNLMIDEIRNALEGDCIGIIISHGTDTLHYTSSALQYSLKNLPVPVVLVGAQRSSDRASSDAYTNLTAAVDFIIENNKLSKKFLRVGACMHESISDDSYIIFEGINLKKLHTSRRDAFKQVNYLPVARIKNSKLEILREDLFNIENEDKLNIIKYNVGLKIGFFKAHPNLFPEEINLLKFYDAVIFEGSGLGHLAVNEVDKYTKVHGENLDALNALAKNCKMIMGSQCVYGQTNMNVYSSGRYIKGCGVLGNHMNLTTENLFIRAAYCLSQKDMSFEDCWNLNLEGFYMRDEDIEE